jgi:hypothetical protein
MLPVVFIAAGVFFALARYSADAADYETTQISALGGAYLGLFPKINSRGQVIWTNTQGIYLYEQGSFRCIVPYEYSVYPTMNDRGEVAWQGTFSGDGIFLSRLPRPLPVPLSWLQLLLK